MASATLFEPHETRPLAPELPALRLSCGAIFWRFAILSVLVGEYKVWRVVGRWVPRHLPGRRVLAFLYFSQRTLFLAFFIAAVVAVSVELGFRLLVRPMMMRWYHPRSRDPHYVVPIAYQLAPGEKILAEIPARRMAGRTRQPGTLVRTNRRLAFYPFAWDAEPWTMPLDRPFEARTAPTVRRVLGWIQGYPDHLELDPHKGEQIALVVADPGAVLAWLKPKGTGLSDPEHS